jgi:hypothetical protein
MQARLWEKKNVLQKVWDVGNDDFTPIVSDMELENFRYQIEGLLACSKNKERTQTLCT